MCPGSSKTKADHLFDIILSPQKPTKSDEEQTIDWRNPRLIGAISKLIYFSELFPKKYYNHFTEAADDSSSIRSITVNSEGGTT